MDVLNLILDNIGLILVLILVIGGIVIVLKFIKGVDRTIRSGMRQINTVKRTINDVSTIAKAVQEVAKEEVATPKSVGGATSLYLKKIQADFPSFHNQDAEAAIRTFVLEYLDIKYGNKSDFQNSKVNKNLLFNVNKIKGQKLSNVIFNGIAIYGYDKTAEYATITYRCSFGYNLNGVREEVRYDIDYTLQLFDNNVAQQAMTCSNCGGVLTATDNNECPYCGTKIIMDTIMSWYITEMTQN